MGCYKKRERLREENAREMLSEVMNSKERRSLKGLRYTEKRKWQRALTVDLATCTLIEKVR